MVRATALLDYREAFEGGFIIAVKMWRVPQPVRGSSHAFKYSLFFGRRGERLVGYDNEQGKGDHRHYGAREVPYVFVSIEQSMTDFGSDIEQVRRTLR
jgi:hypothetical protein